MDTGLGQFIPIAVYAGILFACVASIFWRPQLGIYTVIPLLPLQVLRARLEGFPLGSHAIYLLLLSVIVGLFLKSQLSLPQTPLNKALLLFAVFLYISLWRGSFYLSAPLPIMPSDPRVAIWRDYMAMPLLFVAAVGAIRTPAQIKLVFLIVCLSVLLVDRSALMNVLSRSFEHFDENKRDGGPLGYAGSNGLAAFEAQCSCLLLGFAAYEKGRLRKLVLYGLIALTLYCLLYSFSRGGYISFLAGLLALGLLKDRKMILVVAALLLAWQTVMPLAVQERINMTYGKNNNLETSADQRVQLWTDAAQLINENPIMGSGFATYMFMGRVGQLRDTHNIYIKVLVETGIVGLLIFLWLLAAFLNTAFRLFRAAKDPFYSGIALGLLSLLCCLLVGNLFGDRWTYIEINGIVWVLFAAAVRAYVLETRQNTAFTEIAGDVPRTHTGFSGSKLAPAEIWENTN